uniref:Transposase (Putative), gypsy type n=1 Tax=Tanacetum cinerariifolium TaxID=118510 RepID=A0A6L2MQA4_TANCI|nr:hypothetical protein [Tanacetum cinerariifolium]
MLRRKVGDALRCKRGRVVPLAGVNEQRNQNDDVYDVAAHVVHDDEVNIVVDEEVEANVANKPKVQKKGEELMVLVDGVTTTITMPFIASSVTLSPEGEDGGLLWPNLRTQHPTKRSPTLPPLIMTAPIATTTIAGVTFAPVYESGTGPVHRSIFRDSVSPSTAEADVTYVPKWNVINDSALDDPDVFRSMVDQLDPLGFFSQLRGMDYEQLFAEFNVGVARQACFIAEEKDTEIANLKAQLSLKEAEAAEAIRLRRQVAAIEATEAARVNELNSLKVQTTALEGQVTALESAGVIKDTELASSNAQITKLTQDLSNFQLSCDELSIKVARLDVELMGMALQIDEEFYPCFMTTIVGRRWILGPDLRLVVIKCLKSPEYLVALGGAIGRAIDKGMQDGLAVGIDHGKVGKGLVDVAAYNPFAEANYVFAVNALCAVEFPLLAQM